MQLGHVEAPHPVALALVLERLGQALGQRQHDREDVLGNGDTRCAAAIGQNDVWIGIEQLQNVGPDADAAEVHPAQRVAMLGQQRRQLSAPLLPHEQDLGTARVVERRVGTARADAGKSLVTDTTQNLQSQASSSVTGWKID